MTKYTLCCLVTTAIAIHGRASFGEDEPVRISCSYTIERITVQPRLVVEFFVKKGDKWKLATEILDARSGAPFDEQSYQLTEASGTRIRVVPVPQDLGEQLGSGIQLTVDQNAKLENTKQYTLKILAGKLVFKMDKLIITNKETTCAIPTNQIGETNIEIQKENQGSGTNSITLAGGTPGGISSIRYTYRWDQFLNIEWLHIDFSAKADLTLDTKDKKDFFNNITSELSAYESFGSSVCYSELSVHGKTESDQSFRLTDGLLGVQYAIRPKDPVTSAISEVFVRKNNRAGPLFIVGYDYAHKISGDQSNVVASTDIDTGKADHRVGALVNWRIPITRNYDFSFVPALGGRYDLDCELEGKGFYDINAAKFIDQSWVSLVFRKSTDQTFTPAFTFTWARGKEGPTFQQVNALLAGIKLGF